MLIVAHELDLDLLDLCHAASSKQKFSQRAIEDRTHANKAVRFHQATTDEGADKRIIRSCTHAELTNE